MEQLEKRTVTIITPTYNRSELLPRLYDSLLIQTFCDFDWLIVDDGGSDNSAELITKWRNEQKIAIRYHWQPNGGKHRALNYAFKQLNSQLALIVDSDDWLEANALAVFVEQWQRLSTARQKQCAGVAALAAFPDGRIIGNRFPIDGRIGNYMDVVINRQIRGDKCEIYRSDILRQSAFPEIAGEKFIAESVLWAQISKSYDMLYINQPLLIKEYLADGLTGNAIKIRMASLQGTTDLYRCFLAIPRLKGRARLRMTINYLRFAGHAGCTWPQLWQNCRPLYFLAGWLPARLLCRRDRTRMKKMKDSGKY